MLRLIRFLFLAVIAVVIVSLGFQWVYKVPEAPDRVDTVAVAPTEDTFLGAEILPLARANPEFSGVAPLRQGHFALAARILLADAAQDSIDARYYIWQNDTTGLMLLDALRRAADRGVRVRLLLDDNGTPDLDPELAELGTNPNVEIRLFNPFVLRSPRMLSYILDFFRLNRRMHNKSFTVDGVATIVGGRNIGDIYFSHSEGVNYFDLDVLALGDAATDVAADFDLYWASPSSVPADLILPPAPAGGRVLAASVARAMATQRGQSFTQAVRDSNLMERLTGDASGFVWADMQLVSDDPSKGQGPVDTDALMIARLGRILGTPEKSVDLISAYFVPGQRLTSMLSHWAGQGLRVRVLTNAQESTDVLPVHSGYLKFRDDLLEADVELYELKSLQDDLDRGLRDVAEQFGLVGSSQISLHAKAFVIDGDELFVGSFNFDPRSANLNTEMGFLIKSEQVARSVYPTFSSELNVRAYRVRRGADGGTEWVETSASGDPVVHDKEPGTTSFTRGLVWFMGWLPITWLL